MISRELLRKIRGIELRTRHIVNEVFAGQYHSAFKGSGMEFEEVREYQPGDDVRAIDWNVTARSGVPHLKTFREERELNVVLVVDLSASLLFGSQQQRKREVAAEVAALLALAAIRNQDKVAVLLHSDQKERWIPPGKGPRHVLRIIREILGTEAESPRSGLEEPLSFLTRVLHRKSLVFMIGDAEYSEKDLDALRLSARRHDLIVLRIDDPRDSDWPDAGLLDFIDPETGALFSVDSSDPALRHEILAQRQAWEENQARHCRRHNIDLLPLAIEEAWESDIARFFRSRAARRGR